MPRICEAFSSKSSSRSETSKVFSLLRKDLGRLKHLFRVSNCSLLANNRYFNLTRVLHVALYLLRDIEA